MLSLYKYQEKFIALDFFFDYRESRSVMKFDLRVNVYASRTSIPHVTTERLQQIACAYACINMLVFVVPICEEATCKGSDGLH